MINLNIPSKDPREALRIYLEILNIINPDTNTKLTEGEIKLLIEFILLPEKYSYQRFSRYAKPQVLKALEDVYAWKLTPINLNTKIYELVNKNYIWRDDDGVLYLKEYLIDSAKKLAVTPEIKIKLSAT